MRKGFIIAGILVLTILGIGTYFLFVLEDSDSELVEDESMLVDENIVSPSLPSGSGFECIDSDGEDYFTKGIASEGGYEIEDVCSVGDYTTVREAICKNNVLTFVVLECPVPTKCLDGVCVESSVNCFDSDGGKSYFIKGEVTGPGLDASTSAGFDYCNGDDLFEKYCEDDALGVPPEKYSCPNGCSDGACIE